MAVLVKFFKASGWSKKLEGFGPTAFSIHVPCISIYLQDYSFGAKC
jgi:hypothetical protein